MAGLYGDWEADMGQEEPEYKGYKSDIAFMKAQKKKKAAADKKRKSERKIKKATDSTGYKVVEGDSTEIESYGLPKNKKKKARKVLGRVAR
jgi:hypothetical protein